MQHVRATRYVTPLREGGSLPGLMEADDLGMYVVKFVGAGQGAKALVAEVICAQIANAIGLPVPRWVPIEVAGQLADAEPDEEIQALMRASAGLNLGVDFLPGALDVSAGAAVDPALAGQIIWFDAMVNNVDRSWRNPNLMRWNGEVFLIDHGATLTFHHAWVDDHRAQVQRFARGRYSVADHVLIECDPDVGGADERFGALDWDRIITGAVADVPGEWLDPQLDPQWVRAAYRSFIMERLDARPVWVPALVDDVRSGAVRDPAGHRLSAHRRSGRPTWLTGSAPSATGATR